MNQQGGCLLRVRYQEGGWDGDDGSILAGKMDSVRGGSATTSSSSMISITLGGDGC